MSSAFRTLSGLCLATPLLLATALLASSPAASQGDASRGNISQGSTGSDPVTGWSGFLGIGPAFVPEYAGADKSTVAPFLLGDVDYGPYFLQLRGLSLRANVVPSNTFIAGPLVRLALGRDSDVDNARVARLNEIDTAVEAGGFVGVRFGGDSRGLGRIEASLAATGSENGFLGTAAVSYAALRSRAMFVNLDASLNFASGKHNRTYFGITEPESLRSGLTAYRPDGGLRDVGLGLTAGYQFNARWGLTGRVSYSHLLGDAGGSPIVDREGSRGQLMGGLALSYRF